MKTMLIAAVLAMAAACGGTENQSRFSGTWTGQSEMTALAPFTQPPSTDKRIEISDLPDDQIRIQGLCSDGTGSVDLSPNPVTKGAVITHALAYCTSATVGTCADTQLIFKVVGASINADGSLLVGAAGWALGCDTYHTFALKFTAQR